MALGQLPKYTAIEVEESKAEYLKVIGANASVNALKIIAEASKKKGMEAKLVMAKALGHL